MAYIGVVGNLDSTINSDFSKYTYEYIATAGQTVFTGLDANSASMGYSVGNILVSYGGADLAFSDYTATDGTSVILSDGALVGKIIRVVAFQAFEVSDTYTKAEIDARAGGPSLGSDSIIRTNTNTINEDITIPVNTNGMTAGPVTIADGYTVTVEGTWSII
tara:strand:+ start:1022 stop:1507 length:486 start_codon:yes stop_codon:yes gene_type:complete